MTRVDQEELLKDQNSMNLIAPQDQVAIWKHRQAHAVLVKEQFQELRSMQAWAKDDMRENFTELMHLMKKSTQE